MKRKIVTGPRIIGALIVVAVLLALVFLIRAPAVEVETGVVSRGAMTVTVDDLGETRVTNLYAVSAPITGELLRVPLKPGDPVAAGATVLARVRPAEPGPLDARVLRQAEANIRAAAADLAGAREQEALAERELARIEPLAGRGFVAQATLDRARTAREQAARAAEAAAQRLEAARATLIVPGSRAQGRGAVSVTSPVSGYVLIVPQESARVVVAGTTLVEVGDPARLEMVTDLLSADAVQVEPGAAVSIEGWGGQQALRGTVRLVEPYGFTKFSALGVEEQRVNVVIDFAEPREAWRRLGHGYRATVRITVWNAGDVARVPISALFRSGNRWMTFVVDGSGRARLTPVEIGRMNDEVAELRGGLTPGARVILHPGDRVADGIRVRERSQLGF
ncbi:efflux RND transporter periplasmic adaptor subunit [Sphingosinicella microcystinivorans]|uniref:efflux RND transporter periplasmic adaptor subunit n=1 Tax=Sphingosinicella microcystinivorans TaxID=335406 RepID=UPI0022F3977E|nr:efflux RND transporter periplasmic adaptor subunit [Sphingosinicella microcystinivorans]WBX84179.1 efflux RND transporter periplasmic adaptor subunit [Sphingosinicella microcystinivorans]